MFQQPQHNNKMKSELKMFIAFAMEFSNQIKNRIRDISVIHFYVGYLIKLIKYGSKLKRKWSVDIQNETSTIMDMYLYLLHEMKQK